MNKKYKAIIWDVFWLCPIVLTVLVFLLSVHIWHYIGLNCFRQYFQHIDLVAFKGVDLIVFLILFEGLLFLYTLGFFFVKIFQAIYYVLKKKYNKSLRSFANFLIVLLAIIVWLCSTGNVSIRASFAMGLHDFMETKSFDIDEINDWLDSVNWQDLEISRHPSKPFPKCLDDFKTDWMYFFETDTNKRYAVLWYGPKRFRHGLVFGAKSNEVPNPIDNEYRVDLDIDGYLWIDLEKDRHM